MSKRIKFFLGHLLTSIIVAVCALIVVFGFWYPSPYAKILGVTQIVLMLIAIDVIIGPLLSLIVYKEGKKTLKMDLAVIIILQISALLYGLYNIADGRPVWIVQHSERFEMVRTNDLFYVDEKSEHSKYASLPWFGPKFVAVKNGVTSDETNILLFDELETGISSARRPERLTDITSVQARMIEHSKEIEKLSNYNNKEKVQEILQNYPEADAWMALKTTDTDLDLVVLLNKEKASVVSVVDLRPWN